MSIQLLARDLYRLIREVEALEAALADAAPVERSALNERLRAARAEKEMLQRALEGSKG
ncbi:MAG: hypothetical protein ABIL58_24520 [Pseudomonadota bacterium]